MKVRKKRYICIAFGLLSLFLMLGVIGGVEQGRLSVPFLAWEIPLVSTFWFAMHKAGLMSKCAKSRT